MPKVVALGEFQAVVAHAVGETLNRMTEVRRYAKRLTEAEKTALQNLPNRELGPAWVRHRIRDLRRTADGPCSPTTIAHDVIALLTDGPGPLAAQRAWALMLGLPAGDGMCALDACPVTGERCFGSVLIRLLSDAALFGAAGTLSVAANRGIVLLEFRDGRDAKFRIGLPAGPAFESPTAIARWRALDVQRLLPLFDLLATATARRRR